MRMRPTRRAACRVMGEAPSNWVEFQFILVRARVSAARSWLLVSFRCGRSISGLGTRMLDRSYLEQAHIEQAN